MQPVITSPAEAPLVCATRGGEGSRTVRERAVARAVAEGRPLVFLFVADADGVYSEGTVVGGQSLHDALRSELSWVGNVLLRLAKLQAARSGVTAEIAVLEGKLREQLVQFVQERGAAVVLLGAPRHTTPGVFGDDPVEQLALEIEKVAGVEVEVVRPDDSGHSAGAPATG